MNNFIKNRKFVMSVLVLSSFATLALFQNCSKASFTSSNAAGSSGFSLASSNNLNSQVSTQVGGGDESSSDSTSTGAAAPGRQVASATLQEEDLLTPRVVFSATPNGPAQKYFKPKQTIYGRAYGLSDKLENLEIYYTLVGAACSHTSSCVWSRDTAVNNEIKKTFQYRAENKTWNFNFSLSFDMARRIIIRDKSTVVLDPGFPSELVTVANIAVARTNPEEAKIIAVTDLNSSLKNSSTYGIIADQSLDFYTYHKIYMVGAKVGDIVYCAEVAGTNTCADRNKWQKARTDLYSSIAARQELSDIAYFYAGDTGHYLYNFSYRCGALVGSRANGKTVNYYAEEISTGVKAKGVITYGPMYDCGEYNPGSGKASFGPG